MLKLESDKADLIFRIDGERLDVPIKLGRDEIIFWFEQFAKGDINDPKFKECLAETFVNKVIVWNDKILIVYNVKGRDNEKSQSSKYLPIIISSQSEQLNPTLMFKVLTKGQVLTPKKKKKTQQMSGSTRNTLVDLIV